MPKAARHRKRVRSARLAASGAPLGAEQAADAGSSSANGDAQAHKHKKQTKKESEVANLLDKLRSDSVEDRQWATSALANMFLTFPPVTQRLLLSKNLIGLLIERLNDSDESVTVEALGALRNLAVSSPTSIVSEMHNKRLLLPLMSTHVPTLAASFEAQLLPPAEAQTAPLPSTAEQRKDAEAANQKADLRRRLYWDWSENVLTLLWCLSESTTKILGSLNAHADAIINFAMTFLNDEALDLDGDAVTKTGGMEVDGQKAKKNKKADKRERVPLFVAVAAAQLVHAFTAQNPTAQSHLLRNSNLSSLSTILRSSSAPNTRTARTESHPASDAASDAEDFLQLRVLAFGILLELTKNGKASNVADTREVLKEQQGVLLKLLETDLGQLAASSVEIQKTMDPKIAEQPGAATTGQAKKLASHERQLSTLQLSLEVLGEWCALIEAESLGAELGDDEEEWGGIIDGEGDVEMGEDDDVPADGIFRKQRPDEMDDGEPDDEAPEIELSTSALSLFSSLPGLLLAFARPTPLSFQQTASALVSTPATLISTASADGSAPSVPEQSVGVPDALAAIADILTTVHVRALECLNNLYITLARVSSSPSAAAFFEDDKRGEELQRVWEGTLSLVQGAATASSGLQPAQKEDELDELDQRRMEFVSAGAGAVWGMARIGLDAERRLNVGASTSGFLVSLYNHPFATVATPAGEAIRVRIAGALGWVGRRRDVSAEENEAIGSFLLSMLPQDKTSPLSNSTTPEVLIQCVDSFIDLYSDEESSYDVLVFRSKGFLARLESSVPGVRAAVRKIDRKRFPELRARADGALENLVAFVKYRQEFA